LIGSTSPLILAYNRGTSAYISLNTTASAMQWNIGASAAMSLDASGNLGIGTTSPAKRLQSTDSNGDVLRLQRNDAFTGLWDVKIGQLSTGDFTIRDAENSVNALVIEKGASVANAIYVKNTGNVGIGTATPSSALQISKTATIIKSTSTGDNSTYVQFEANSGAGSPFYVGQDSSTGGSFGKGAYASVLWQVGAYPLIFSTSNAERLRIASTGAFGLSGANYGSSGQVLTSGGSGAAPTWTTVSSGGSPGGSNTQVQFNNSGSFGGSAGLTWNGTTLSATAMSTTTLFGTKIQVANVQTWSDNSSHGTFDYAYGFFGVLTIQGTQTTNLPFMTNGGSGIAYNILVFNPATGQFAQSFSFTQNGTAGQTFSISGGGPYIGITYQRTSGSGSYTVTTQHFTFS